MHRGWRSLGQLVGYVSQDDSIIGNGDAENLIASICFDMINRHFSWSFVLSLRPNTPACNIYTLCYSETRRPSAVWVGKMPRPQEGALHIFSDANLGLTKR